MIRTPSSSAARLAAKAEDDFSRTPSRPGSASRPMSATRRRIADSLEFSNDLGSSKKNIVSPMKLTSLKGALSAPGLMGALQSTLVDAEKLGTPLSRRPSSSTKHSMKGERGPYEISDDSEEDVEVGAGTRTMRKLEFASKDDLSEPEPSKSMEVEQPQPAKPESEVPPTGEESETSDVQKDAPTSSTKPSWLSKRSSTTLEEQKRLARERGRQRALLRQLSMKEQEKQEFGKQEADKGSHLPEVLKPPHAAAEGEDRGKESCSLPEAQQSQGKEEANSVGDARPHSSPPPPPALHSSSSISAPHKVEDGELRLSDLSPPSSVDRPLAGFQLQSASRAASFAEQKRLARERGRKKVLERQQAQKEEEEKKGEGESKPTVSSDVPKEVKSAWSSPEEASRKEEKEEVDGSLRKLEGFEEQKRLAQERGKQKALEREAQRREQSRLAAEARKAEEERAREQEAIERKKQEAEARRRKEEQEARAKLEAEIAARMRAEEEKRENERQLHRKKGMELCEDAKTAAEKKQFGNAKSLLSAAQEELRRSGMEEDEEEVITRGLRQFIERKQEEHLQVLREEEERLLRQKEERMRELEEEARRANERAIEEARKRTEQAWFRAAEQGKHHKLDAMIEDGSIVDPDLRDEHFRTALHVASTCGQKKAVRTLLRRGAEIDNKDAEGRTALVLAELHRHEEVADYLREKGADTSMLEASRRREGGAAGAAGMEATSDPLERVKQRFFAAARSGDAKELQELLGKGVHPDVEDGQGNSALLLSTVFGHEEAVDALIQSGCNLNPSNSAGETPLTLARSCHALSLVRGKEAENYKNIAAILEQNGASESPSYMTIRTRNPASSSSTDHHHRPPSASSSAQKHSKKRPGTATVMKAAMNLFSVFDKSKAKKEVLKLEEEVKDLDKARAKLSKAEKKANEAAEKASKAHQELLARAERFAPQIERVKETMRAMRNFDDAKSLLAEAKALEREGALSKEALEAFAWPKEELMLLQSIVDVQNDLNSLLRACRHLDAEDDPHSSNLRKNLKFAIKTLSPLMAEDDETVSKARDFGIPLDGNEGLIQKCCAATEELVEVLFQKTLEAEEKLSDTSRGKKAIKKDIQVAYDLLDKALDLAEEGAESLSLNIVSPSYEECQRRLKLLETQYAHILF